MLCLGRAIELEPGLIEAHNKLGRRLQEAGRTDEAITVFRREIAEARLCRGP